MNKTIFAIFLIVTAGLVGCLNQPPAESASTTSTVTYIPTTAIFANPERGFYRYAQIDSSDPYVLDSQTLTVYRQNENVTLLYCLFVLDEFVEQPISAAFLETIAQNFTAVRESGLKCVLRFAYTYEWIDEDGDGEPDNLPYGDADKATILGHLEQLRPLIVANSDVIAVWQAGFIGIFGEWYYTDHFVDNPAVPYEISAARYADRLEVLTALLDVLPTSRMTQIRYLEQKRILYDETAPLAPTEAYSGMDRARVGFHNDCFLSSDDDVGTFNGDDPTADYPYLAAESTYTPMGGESCAHNPPRSDCPTATSELALFHYTYLNSEYHEEVLQSWVDGGCMNEIKRRLGYRLELQEGVYQDQVRPNDGLQVTIQLKNVGYSAPLNPRDVVLVLRNHNDLFTATLPDDPRLWLADGNIVTLNYNIHVPNCVPTGAYELHLYLPDPLLPERPEYAARIANDGVWEAASGYNDLGHTVVVSENAASHPAAGGISFVGGECVQETLYLPAVVLSAGVG
ncbi:MAG: DUF4832 domain-containing protein [Anaerolineales bacterium]|nr:DUF4832 domain-containing protein [Anaerolineales bacterium]